MEVSYSVGIGAGTAGGFWTTTVEIRCVDCLDACPVEMGVESTGGAKHDACLCRCMRERGTCAIPDEALDECVDWYTAQLEKHP